MKHAAWMSIIGAPLLRIYWLAIPDVDSVKWEPLKSRLEQWLDAVNSCSNPQSPEIPTVVILHFEEKQSILNLNNKAQQQLSDKVRQLRNLHCFSFQPLNRNESDSSVCERLAASLHSLLALQILERIRRVEEIARVEREKCFRAAMGAGTDDRFYFANMFLLEEAVARAYSSISLFDESLARLDMIDAVLSQSAANCFYHTGGRPVASWIDQCLCHPPTHVDCVRLVPTVSTDWPTSPCPLMLLENGRHPLIETRAELLARISAVIFRMCTTQSLEPNKLTPLEAVSKIGSYALQFAHNVVVESKQLKIGNDNIVDSFIYLLYCEASVACKTICSISATPMISQGSFHLGLLGLQALKSLQRIGERSGFVLSEPEKCNAEDSESLKQTVEILQMLRYRSSSISSQANERQENHSDRLARILKSPSPDNLAETLIEIAESLLATFKVSGLRRLARRTAYELAFLYLQSFKCNSGKFPLLSAAEGLLFDCVGAWLSSKNIGLANAALKLMVNELYQLQNEDEQNILRRTWSMLHLNAFSLGNEDKTDFKDIESISSRLKNAEKTAPLTGKFLFTCTDINVSNADESNQLKITLTIRSKYGQDIENCSCEITLRLMTIQRRTTLLYHHHQQNQHQHQNELIQAIGLPPFRPEASSHDPSAPDHGDHLGGEMLTLKNGQFCLKSNELNRIDFYLVYFVFHLRSVC